ncbi:STAS domain-containing protein [Actinoplanes subglobosus]|uniref:Anti-sigma factor antagonist n=1 Tax=Actinoplanes subglobosus TaxID=1547892 RepID=A0ABV8J109_9ACTN
MNFAQSAHRLTLVVGEADADARVRVGLIGELDFDEADRLRDAVDGAIEQFGPAHVALDATELAFLDSAGIRALLQCRDSAEKVGATLSVEGVSPIVHQVLRVTELLEYLRVTTVVDV